MEKAEATKVVTPGMSPMVPGPGSAKQVMANLGSERDNLKPAPAQRSVTFLINGNELVMHVENIGSMFEVYGVLVKALQAVEQEINGGNATKKKS